eukprot:g17996.t1
MEQSLFRCYTGTIPHLFLCYIDDCISTTLGSHEELEQFINFTNTFHPNPKPMFLTASFAPTTPGTFPCNRRRCYTYPYTSPLASIQGTKQTFHIRQRFTCTSANVVYSICCSQCGLLYI